MAYYFIYTATGGSYYHPNESYFNFDIMKQFAPSAKRHHERSDVHTFGENLDIADFKHAFVIQIDNESEAVAFKMMQDKFIDTSTSKHYRRGQLTYILENPDWKAIYDQGPDLEDLALEKRNRDANTAAVNTMNRKQLKFLNEFSLGRQAVGMDEAYKEFSAKLEEAILSFRAENKRITDQLKRQRAKVKKKALSYAIFKAK